MEKQNVLQMMHSKENQNLSTIFVQIYISVAAINGVA